MMPSVRKVSITPGAPVADLKPAILKPGTTSPPLISRLASGAPIIAPPPKPMIAMPVAMPRRSGNHLMRVETGEM